jgi:hypothetical protein
LAALAVTGVQAADGGVYRVTVTAPPIISELTQATVLDIGTRVVSIDRVSVRVSGIHTNGWWVGDPTEFPYEGPAGASLDLYVIGGWNVRIPGIPREGWYANRLQPTNDGAFIASFSLIAVPDSLFTRAYVPDGGVGLACVAWATVGLGSWARAPYLALSEVEVELEVKPVLEITSMKEDGFLSWSALPAGGTIEILAADKAGGPWEVEARLPSDQRSTTLIQPSAGACRFYHLRWQNDASP